MPRSNKQAIVAKVPELPSLIALDTAVLLSKRRREVKLVPDNLRGDFVESELASELHKRWADNAADVLDQFHGVSDGDWEAAGHKTEEDNTLRILETFGQTWKEYAENYDEQHDQSIVWIIDNRIDSEDFETLVNDFLANYDLMDLDTEEALRDAIEEFKGVVEKEVEDA